MRPAKPPQRQPSLIWHSLDVVVVVEPSLFVVVVRWVTVVPGNVKRAISGCYHAVRQAKYARRYLAEAAYRFNRRFRLAALLPRLARAMNLCKPWPELKLRAVDNFHG
jgi:hypothetical protein